MDHNTADDVQMIAGVLALLSDADPYGLAPGTDEGAPADEYEPEAAEVARILREHGSVTVQDLERVWLRWFDVSMVGQIGSARVARLVRDLNDLRGNVR